MKNPISVQLGNKRRHVAFFVIQWSISILAFTYALWSVDYVVLFSTVRSYPFFGAMFPLVFVALDYVCMARRLQNLLPGKVKYFIALRGVVLCLGYNNILPAKAGDMIKVVYLSKVAQSPIAVIAPSILWERCLDLLVLIVFSLIATQFTPIPLSCGVSFVFIFIFFIVFYIARKFSAQFHCVYTKLGPRFSDVLHNLHLYAIDNIVVSKVFINFLLSCVIWLLNVATFMFCFLAIGNLNLSPQQVFVVFVVTCLGTVLPSSPASLGLFEGAMVLSLSWYGIGSSEALGMALYIHALYFLPVTAAALWVGRRFSDEVPL